MTTAAAIFGVVIVILARARRQQRRRERLIAERLQWLALQDERAAQSTLRPRTGEVVASVQIAPNGYHRANN